MLQRWRISSGPLWPKTVSTLVILWSMQQAWFGNQRHTWSTPNLYYYFWRAQFHASRGAFSFFLFFSLFFFPVFYCTGVFCLLITDLAVMFHKVWMHICGHKKCQNFSIYVLANVTFNEHMLCWRQQEYVCVKLIFWKIEIEPFW